MSTGTFHSPANKAILGKIFNTLLKAAGPRQWWPAKTAFEVMVGAILTQNTSWKNVEKAIANIRKEKLLSFKKFSSLKIEKIAQLVRPSGYYNQKAKKLKTLTDFIHSEYGGSIKRMEDSDTAKLREELLSLNGIGMETADSILLYALNKPVFVVDLYTKRILSRHEILPFNSSYEEVQRFFVENLSPNVSHYNEYHALLVFAGNRYCRKTPACEECPLKKISYND
ncbi:MAG: endonuclease III domain-containing protein [Candidatus Schekmanbacteria bacterium]|nr:endonuclease III domain-containing protein [Candidatus Schekmanbacteria bacterium]